MTSQGSYPRNGVIFFKVILENNLRDRELRIPKSFVQRYWQEISSRVILRLPNGTEWRVYWLKRDGDVWFRNGWHEFAEYLSLKESQFLVFQYEGDSKFSVIVLGRSGLEIKYPSSSSRAEDVEKNEGRNNGHKSDDCSLEILDDEKRMPRFQSPYSSLSHKKMKISPKEEPQENGGISEDFDEKITKFLEEIKSSFRSDKPYFMCLLRRSYSERDLLVIPNEFAKPFLHWKEGDAILFVDQKGAWDVRLKQTSRQFTFTAGWKKFFIDNNLKLGDVCIFELMNVKQVSFRVLIYRFGEESSTPRFKEHEELSHLKPSSSHKNHQVSKAKSKFMVIKNSFTLEMKNVNSAQYVVIPMEFIKNYGLGKETFVILRIGERTWSVKILYYQQTSNAKFSQGWTQFAKDCNLVAGDSCRFHLIDKDNLEFQVSIIRGKFNI